MEVMRTKSPDIVQKEHFIHAMILESANVQNPLRPGR